MKADIHPEYKSITVTCSCGSTFETRSTADSLSVELCSQCHPFYTGKQKLVDTGGRIDRFERRYGRRKNAAPAEDEATDEAADAPVDEAADAPVDEGADAPADEAADAPAEA